jgi:hypothetical protein
MSREIGRREFFRNSGAGLLTVGAALYPRDGVAAEAKPATPESAADYKVKWYEFTEHKVSDTCWSLSVGPDGRIYAAACAEGVPGGVVKVTRYNEAKDGLDYLFDCRRWWMIRAIRAGPRSQDSLQLCALHARRHSLHGNPLVRPSH